MSEKAEAQETIEKQDTDAKEKNDLKSAHLRVSIPANMKIPNGHGAAEMPKPIDTMKTAKEKIDLKSSSELIQTNMKIAHGAAEMAKDTMKTVYEELQVLEVALGKEIERKLNVKDKMTLSFKYLLECLEHIDVYFHYFNNVDLNAMFKEESKSSNGKPEFDSLRALGEQLQRSLKRANENYNKFEEIIVEVTKTCNKAVSETVTYVNLSDKEKNKAQDIGAMTSAISIAAGITTGGVTVGGVVASVIAGTFTFGASFVDAKICMDENRTF